MSTATLYEIRDDLDALAALLAEVGGDVTEAEAEAAIDEWLKETDEALRDKLDRYAGLIRETESRAAARKAEAKRLAERAAIDANTVARLKARLLWFMKDQGHSKLETHHFRLTVQANGGKVPVVVYADPVQLPPRYQHVTYAPNLDAIRETLEAGHSLSFAALGERGQHLRIG